MSKLVILFVTVKNNSRKIQYLLVLFVLGYGPEKVWIVISVVAGYTSLGTVANNHGPKIINVKILQYFEEKLKKERRRQEIFGKLISVPFQR